MFAKALRPALLLVLLVLGACGQEPVRARDSGVRRDAGPPDADLIAPLRDASTPDAADASLAPEADTGAPDGDVAPGPDADLADANLEAPDASVGPPDAEPADAEPPDAEPMPGPDAAEPDDAAAPAGLDADLSGPDAASPGPDAASPGPDAAAAGPDAGAPCDADCFFPLRVMAANLTSGPNQNYDLGHGLRLIQAMAPDVVLIQEFRYGDDTEATMQAMVDSTVGAGFSWCREYATPPPAGTIPNGIISRWPILECASWDDPKVYGSREFAYARIDLPGPRDLWAVSLHLLTKDDPTRNAEATSLAAYLKGFVPAGDFLVIGGDFNTTTMSESCYATLSGVVDVAAPHPADQKGNIYTNAKRQLPYDHVFAGPSLRALQVPTEIGSSTFPAGLVLDSRVYTPLDEIPPVLVDDSDAPSMQHMGVVKDFLVPY